MTEDLLAQTAFSALLDELIPARGDSLPGAGSLGIGAYVAEKLGDTEPFVAAGLEALDRLARERGAAGFADLPVAERASVVSEVDENQPGFVRSLLFHAYSGYYQDLRVAAAIGLAPRPPFPQGYELESGDLGLLDSVRKREKLYRDI